MENFIFHAVSVHFIVKLWSDPIMKAKNEIHIFVNFTDIVKNAQRIMGTKYRGSQRRCSIKRRVLKMFVNFVGENLCQGLFLKKLQDSDKKETLEQVFARNFCKIFSDIIFTEHLQTTASGSSNFKNNAKELLCHRWSEPYHWPCEDVSYTNNTRELGYHWEWWCLLDSNWTGNIVKKIKRNPFPRPFSKWNKQVWLDPRRH